MKEKLYNQTLWDYCAWNHGGPAPFHKHCNRVWSRIGVLSEFGKERRKSIISLLISLKKSAKEIEISFVRLHEKEGAVSDLKCPGTVREVTEVEIIFEVNSDPLLDIAIPLRHITLIHQGKQHG